MTLNVSLLSCETSAAEVDVNYADLITFFLLIPISSHVAKMTPGHPEGCSRTRSSLIPCGTNKAELPPHLLTDRHQSWRAKGGGGVQTETAKIAF